jgi:hypothetical protein
MVYYEEERAGQAWKLNENEKFQTMVWRKQQEIRPD